MPKKNILVLGDGAWGTTLALNLFRNGHRVGLWSVFPDYLKYLARRRVNTKFLPGVKLPAGIKIQVDIAQVMRQVNLIVMAVPTQYAAAVLKKVKPFYSSSIPVVSVSKGIEYKTLRRPSEIIKKILGARKICVLSGPSHAEEVARGLPATVVVASRDHQTARLVQRVFMNERFRIYTHSDVVGVELGGALKNVIAIAAGIAEGLKLGDNARSALLTRGLAEMARLGVKLGARPSTFFGVSGVGDLITTCVSPHGRNRYVGLRIGQGATLKQVMKKMHQVAEGVWTTRSVRTLGRRHKVSLPITSEVYQVLFKNKNSRRAVRDLMTRQPKAENEN
ncbi:MAG: NAD(P)-dependent glycerol-3-phosphate dehydrogenase [Planctomycetes bacterium]|nr:NAD(P)-dependent glycerol-3-phosphate dehydrogenase [Planctomycetota bacterium]MCK5578334.1 NAD(P)-dependent glycerol-3-phosphate dehydrogenase [Planctomycetota bacterium]